MAHLQQRPDRLLMRPDMKLETELALVLYGLVLVAACLLVLA